MDVQFQIRQNAMEMQEYMKDLFEWQKSIKKKERATMSNNSVQSSSGASGTPAPRGRASGSVAPAPAALMSPAIGPKTAPAPAPAQTSSNRNDSADQLRNSTTAAKRHAAEHTYTSYKKWDRFDVDAALASSDEEGDASGTRAQRSSAVAAPMSAASSLSSSTPGPAGGAGVREPLAASPSGPSASPAPVLAPVAPPTIAFREDQQPGGPGQQPQEDLLRPLATTRVAQNTGPQEPSAPAAASTARPGAGAGSAQAAATASPPATLPPIRNSQPTAPDAWRARGNDLFKAGQYDSAYECYSRSVELQPTCLGHANRAMALLKMGRWKEAVLDCSEALRLDPTYVKAYQRRAAAHRQLGAAAESARDWEQALRLEPENRATAADRDAALEALMAELKLPPPSRRTAVQVTWPAATAVVTPPEAPGSREGQPAGAASESGAAGSAAKAVQASEGLKPSRREAQQEEQREAEANNAPGGAGPSAGPDRPGSGSEGGQRAPDGAPASSPAPEEATDGALVGEVPSPPDSRSGNVSSVEPTAAAVATRSVEPVPSPSSTTPGTAAPSLTVAAAAGAAVASASASSSSRPMPVPRTSVEFEAAWRGLAGDPARQAAYLAAIPPASLPATFKNSLTAPVLSSIVRCLLPAITTAASVGTVEGDPAIAGNVTGEVAPPVGVALLEALTRVARFDLMAMSVPSRERTELRTAWDGLDAALGRWVAAGDGAGNGAAGLRQRLFEVRPKYRL